MNRMRSRFGGRFWAAILSGSLVGVLIFAIAMIWRGAKSETIVLQVQPIGDPNIVRVYVGGQVVTPGLYSLTRGSRVAEAIAAAGGASPDGDTASFGMAARLEDGDQIIIPAKRAVPTAPIRAVSGAATLATVEPAAPGDTAIDINSASADELETLPDIGPALAALIVEYREVNGPFNTIDELEVISGISERMVDELRDLITVGQ